jgi:molybdate transport system ATP-binding protein
MTDTSALSVELRIPRPDFCIDVAFELSAGITILFGPSGAGKSSVLQAIAGLVAPDSGRISRSGTLWFDSATHHSLPVHERGIGYVFQELSLFPHMTVRKNINYGLVGKLDGPAQRRATETAMTKFAIAHAACRYPKTLSGGEAQRVAMARAFAFPPALVLCDEPFSALDAELRLELMTKLKQTVTELGIPALHVTHDRTEAITLGDDMLMLERGAVTKRGKPRELLQPKR